MMVFLVVMGCGSSNDAAPAANFTQADLVGTWRVNVLKTGGTNNGWMRGRITVDAAGVATCVSTSDSTGATTCPSPFDLTFTMTGGVITQTGDHAATTSHMTMTSNKNLMAGTGTSDGGNSYQLMIAQKEVEGTSYIAADVQNKNFVYHQLMVGDSNNWEYGEGTTDILASVNISSSTTPSGNTIPGDTGCTLEVDTAGVVTLTGLTCDMSYFSGFLSDDKKTIVATRTEEDSSGNPLNTYQLYIFQITGQTYTAGNLPDGVSIGHLLGVQDTGANAFWAHYTNTASSGTATFTNWVNSDSAPTPSPANILISSLGVLTESPASTFHGQMSHDGMFSVSTQSVVISGSPDMHFRLLAVHTK